MPAFTGFCAAGVGAQGRPPCLLPPTRQVSSTCARSSWPRWTRPCTPRQPQTPRRSTPASAGRSSGSQPRQVAARGGPALLGGSGSWPFVESEGSSQARLQMAAEAWEEADGLWPPRSVLLGLPACGGPLVGVRAPSFLAVCPGARAGRCCSPRRPRSSRTLCPPRPAPEQAWERCRDRGLIALVGESRSGRAVRPAASLFALGLARVRGIGIPARVVRLCFILQAPERPFQKARQRVVSAARPVLVYLLCELLRVSRERAQLCF